RDGELLLERAELAHVLSVHALRHVLERAYGFLARLALPQPRERQLEQRDRRREALDDSRAEDLARLGEREHRRQVALHAHAAQREHTVLRQAEREQSCDLRRAIAEVDEATTAHDAEAELRREMVEARLERRAVGVAAHRCEPLADQ